MRSGGISRALLGNPLITVRSETFFSPNKEHPVKITNNRIKLRDW